jgi:hypothetical protein
MAGYTNNQPGTPHLLNTTSTVSWAKGVVGLGGGVSNDTILNGLKIAQNATAVTATVTGFRDHTGANTSIVFTGSTTQDTWWPLGWINTNGALTVTASVSGKVIVETVASGLVP